MSNLLVTSANYAFLEYAKVVFASSFVNGGWTDDMMLLTYNIDDKNPDLQWFRDRNIIIKKLDTNLGIMISRFETFGEYYKKWEHVLHLDADIYVQHSLEDLSTFIPGFWACTDWGMSTLRSYGFGDIGEGPAFNAGVFWFPTEENSDDRYKEILAITEQIDSRIPGLFYLDQYALNVYFSGKWKHLPVTYNLFIDGVFAAGHRVRDIDAVILHYAANHSNMWYWEEDFKKCLRSFDASKSSVTKVVLQKDFYQHNLVEVKIKRGDCLWKLFGDNWRNIYNLTENTAFRNNFPDPNFIEPGVTVMAPPTSISSLIDPSRATVAVAGEFMTRLFESDQILVGAEIGCSTGDTSSTLLSHFNNLRLYMVDKWENYDDFLYCPECNFEDIYKAALDKTDFANERRIVLRGFSHEMVECVTEPLDFVFIDANHDYAHVKQDLELWYPKVKKGGLVSGHDWNWEGVDRAVKEFAEKIGVEINITRTTFPLINPAWYFWA